jgi:hypothetical protein
VNRATFAEPDDLNREARYPTLSSKQSLSYASFHLKKKILFFSLFAYGSDKVSDAPKLKRIISDLIFLFFCIRRKRIKSDIYRTIVNLIIIKITFQ